MKKRFQPILITLRRDRYPSMRTSAALKIRYIYLLMILVFFSNLAQTWAQLPTNGNTQNSVGCGNSTEAQEHPFGVWNGVRTRLSNRGFDFDFSYLSDQLWDVRSVQQSRFSEWIRLRGTLDIDLGKAAAIREASIHVTAVWQGGSNLGQYLGVAAGPSGTATQNTFRLDSWWLEKRFNRERIAFRIGQFAGQDSYGSQHFGSSFLLAPLTYALINLTNVYETFDPPSTPAMEIRTLPTRRLSVKSMVMAGDRIPFAHNPSGLIPQFRGTPVSATELAWSVGKPIEDVKIYDTPEDRIGYSGLYKIGAIYNPGTFNRLSTGAKVSGDQMWYAMASQAVYRPNRRARRGLDVTVAEDWSPSSRNQQDRTLTAGLRFNDVLNSNRDSSVGVGYVRSSYSSEYRISSGSSPLLREHALECNMLFNVKRYMLVQPVAQMFLNAGGTTREAIVVGFHTKVNF